MLKASSEENETVRFSTPEVLEEYVAGGALKRTPVSQQEALEEAFFLGLRLNKGVDLDALRIEFGADAIRSYDSVIADLVAGALIKQDGNSIRLTPRGRLLSNEVFERLLLQPK
jgi:oxygen-independent coproporphyrinogen-3 oxidase